MSFTAALIVGIFFGFILQKVGFTRYSKIVNVYRFTDLSVLKFMLTAIVVGSVGIYLLRDLGLVKLTGSTPTYLVGNFVGALLFGAGMALAGFCPGTCLAGIGRGNLDYLIPGLLGFLAGAILFGVTYAQVFPIISSIANYGVTYLPDLFNVNHWLLIAFLALFSAYLFYILARKGDFRLDRVRSH
jgi:uncharacterized membrane protein YedE/YeeE